MHGIGVLTFVMVFCVAGCSRREDSQRAPTAYEVFQMRSECARIGQAYEERLGPVGSALFRQVTTRYDAGSNRCRIEVDTRSANLSVDANVIHLSVVDGQTHAVIAFANLENGRRTFLVNNHPEVRDFDAAAMYINDLMDDR